MKRFIVVFCLLYLTSLNAQNLPEKPKPSADELNNLAKINFAQSDNAPFYTFGYSTGTYSAISGTLSTAAGDDGTQTVTLPFTFNLDGTNFTQITISVNGAIGFGTLNPGFSNDLASTSYRPVVAALWDDLYDDAGGDIQYTTSGTSPNRVFIIQWRNVRWYYSGGTQQNFQIKLYETSNKIDIVYGAMNAPGSSPSASIGFNDNVGGSGRFISVTPGTTHSVSYTVANNSIAASTYLASGLTYSFSPGSSGGVLSNRGTITPTTSSQTSSYTSGTIPYWTFSATAGTTYNFSMCSNSEDSYLRIYDVAGSLLASNDDYGPLCSGVPASLSFTPASAGNYYVVASHFYFSNLSNNGSLEYYIPMMYSSSNVLQNTSFVTKGTTNQSVICIPVVTIGSLSPTSVTQFSLSTTGTTSTGNISNAKIFYTGSSQYFSTSTQFGSTVASPSGTYTINGTQQLATGTNYFWLTYDISSAASNGNLIDAVCNSLTVAGVSRIPTTTAPTGARKVTSTSFSQNSGSYQTIAGGTVLGTVSNDDQSFNAINLGFNFVYNGVSYSQVSIQSNGFVAMGSSVNSSYNPLSSGSSNNVVSGLAQDLQGNGTTSELSYKINGVSPNRLFIVQWKDYKRFGTTGDVYNFQIRLYEATNKIEIVYGSFTRANDYNFEVGLRFSSNADFMNRRVTNGNNTWTASAEGFYNTDASQIQSGFMPASGLTYTYTQSALPPLSGSYTIGLLAFNKHSGKNIYTESVKKNVLKEVPYKNGTPSKETEKNFQNTYENISGEVEYKTIEVEEEYYELMEDGKIYGNELYINSADGPSNGVYATLTAAINDLNTRGVSGPVTFLLSDASYLAESFPLTINSVPGVSSANTITIKPNTGVNTTLSASAESIIKIHNTNYVIIDGSNSNGTDRSLTIQNTNTGISQGIWIASNGTNPISNITVKNCNISTGENISGSTPILVSDGSISSNPGYFSNITLTNNNLKKGRQAIYCNGGTSPQNGSNLTITNNIITSSGTDAIGYMGIYMQGVTGATVTGNEIANLETSEYQDDIGIWFASGTSNATANRNKIYNLGYTGTGGYGASGLKVSTALNDANILLSNNVVYNIFGDGWNYETIIGDNPIGVNIFSVQSGIKVYNNSINLYGNTLNQTGALSVGIFLGTDSYADIRNNVISNNLGLLSATGYGSAGVYAQTASSQFTVLNYNNYYIEPSGTGVKAIGKISTTSVSATLPLWIIMSGGKDVNSYSGNPGFSSQTNLQPDLNSANSWVLSGNGIHLAEVSTDYSGNSRPSGIENGAPDIGAYEFSVPNIAPALFTITPVSGSNDVYVNGRKIINLNFNSLGGISSVSLRFYTGVNPPGISGYPSAQFMNAYFDLQQSGGSNFNYDITYYYSEPQRGTIVIEDDIRISKSENSGVNWNSFLVPGTGTGQYNLNTANNTVKVFGLNAFSVFTNSDANAPLPVKLASFKSSSMFRDINLNWVTVEELNNSGFDIERKTLNSDWVKIGFMNGKNTPSSYEYKDRNLTTGKYQYRLKQIDFNGNYEYHTLDGIVEVGVPAKYDLSQNYPNPFNPVTKINFDLPKAGQVSLKVFDILGKEVKTLVNEFKDAGYYNISFDASGLPSGVYFYRISAGEFSSVKKLVLMK